MRATGGCLLYKETERLELRTIEVVTTMAEDDLARLVTEAFGKR
jgi:hypothetical protein